MAIDNDWVALIKAQLDPAHTRQVRADGAKAYSDGKEWGENPYPKHDLDYGQWGRGWLDAELEARQRLRPRPTASFGSTSFGSRAV